MPRMYGLEKILGGWYEKAPHLPLSARQWLAENIWWLALVGTVVNIFGLVVVVPVLLTAMLLFTPLHGLDYPSLYSISSRVNLLITLASYMINTLLLILAIRPLRLRHRSGWELLFWSFVVNAVLNILNALVVASLPTVLATLVFAAIAGYLLFEMHDYFGKKPRTAKKAR